MLNIFTFVVLIFLTLVVLWSLPPSRTILGARIFCRHESLPVLTLSQFFQPLEALYILQKVTGLFLILFITGCTNPRTLYILLKIKMLKKYFFWIWQKLNCYRKCSQENWFEPQAPHIFFSQSYLS